MPALDTAVLPAPGCPVVVAVSGGADSCALWDLLVLDGRWPLIVWHLDHQLRPESAAEAAAVRRRADWYAAQGCGPAAVIIASAPVAALAAAAGEGIEAAARRIRYERLIAVARQHQAPAVATAHHRGDQAETMVLNILRGAGRRGLGGIPAQRPLAPGVVVCRPLLDADPGDLRAHLRARGLDWSEDASNTDRRFRRNAVRHDLLPAWEAACPGVGALLAEQARGHARIAAGDANAALRRWQAHAAGGFLAAAAWIDAPAATRTALWMRLLGVLGCSADRRRLRRLDDLAEGGPGRALRLGPWRLVRRAGGLRWEELTVTSTPSTIHAPGPWPAAGLLLTNALAPDRFAHDHGGCWLDAAILRWPLVWRVAAPGERWQPLGAPGRQTVAKYRSEHALPRRAMLLADADGPLWIPGGTIAERARAAPAKPAVHITAEPQDG
jgi:tRNA(Ile)-lysidine synthase